MLKRILSKKVLLGVIVVLILGGAGYAAYYYYNRYNQVVKNPEIITKQEADYLSGQVSKLMKLPNEQPTIATVTDKTKLKDQAFFKDSENGDKVLVYLNAKEAILYRPSENLIISVGPVNTDNSSTAGTSQPINIAIYNGTTTSGLTSSIESKINASISNVTISSTGNAKNDNYKSTIVVDLTGSKPDQAKAVADAVGGTVGSLPAGETKPSADILVIAGQ